MNGVRTLSAGVLQALLLLAVSCGREPAAPSAPT